MDITYEDISLKFLYWPDAKMDGSDTVDGLNCWKLHLAPGSQASAYAAVEVWVSKRTGNFLEGEGYNGAGKLVKRFKAVSGQRDPQGGWMLKQMRIETISPAEGEGRRALTWRLVSDVTACSRCRQRLQPRYWPHQSRCRWVHFRRGRCR